MCIEEDGNVIKKEKGKSGSVSCFLFSILIFLAVLQLAPILEGSNYTTGNLKIRSNPPNIKIEIPSLDINLEKSVATCLIEDIPVGKYLCSFTCTLSYTFTINSVVEVKENQLSYYYVDFYNEEIIEVEQEISSNQNKIHSEPNINSINEMQINTDVDSLLMIGEIYLIEESYHEAFDLFNKLFIKTLDNKIKLKSLLGMMQALTNDVDFVMIDSLLNDSKRLVKTNEDEATLKLSVAIFKIITGRYIEADKVIFSAFHLTQDPVLKSKIVLSKNALRAARNEFEKDKEEYERYSNLLVKQIYVRYKEWYEKKYRNYFAEFRNFLSEAIEKTNVNNKKSLYLFWIASSYVYEQNYRDAIIYCDSLNSICNNNFWKTYAQFFKAALLQKQSKFNEAEEIYLSILSESWDKDQIAKATLGLGELYSLKNDWEFALGMYTTVLAIPQNIEKKSFTHFKVGIAYAQLSKLDSAIVHFEKAMELTNNNLRKVRSLINIGIALSNQGHYKEADEKLQLADLLTLSPELHKQISELRLKNNKLLESTIHKSYSDHTLQLYEKNDPRYLKMLTDKLNNKIKEKEPILSELLSLSVDFQFDPSVQRAKYKECYNLKRHAQWRAWNSNWYNKTIYREFIEFDLENKLQFISLFDYRTDNYIEIYNTSKQSAMVKLVNDMGGISRANYILPNCKIQIHFIPVGEYKLHISFGREIRSDSTGVFFEKDAIYKSIDTFYIGNETLARRKLPIERTFNYRIKIGIDDKITKGIYSSRFISKKDYYRNIWSMLRNNK